MKQTTKTDNLDLLKFEGMDPLAITMTRLRILLLFGAIPTLLITLSDSVNDLMIFLDTREPWIGMLLSFGGFVFSILMIILLFQGGFMRRLATIIHNIGINPQGVKNVRLGGTMAILFSALAWLILYSSYLKSLWIGYGSLVFWWLFVFLISTHWLFEYKTNLQIFPALMAVILLVTYVSVVLDSSFSRIRVNFPPNIPVIIRVFDGEMPLVPQVFHDDGKILNALVGFSTLPTSDDLALGPEEDLLYLQSILDIIFPNGTSGLTEEQISMDILKYVSTYMRLETNTGSATKMLQEGYAICGGMSISFQALTRMAGIPSRYVGIFGLPQQVSHALAEVYYAGQWHLFDPTFGLIFYTEPEYNGRGKIPSMAEVRSGAAQGLYLFKVVEHPWQGKYDAEIAGSFNVTPAGDAYLSDYYGYDFISLYRHFFSISFPNTSIESPILSLPVEVNFDQVSSTSIGELDGSVDDMLHASSLPETAGRVGARYIGGGDMEEVETWFIKSSTPGYFRITYFSTEADPPQLLLFPLKAIYVVDWRQKDGKAEFTLHMSDTYAALQFWAEDGIFWIDKWQADWLGQSFIPIH